jgi:glycosyltransferase involved in cell wall biosynthesis
MSDLLRLKRTIRKKSINLIHATGNLTVRGQENITVLTVHDLIFLKDRTACNRSFSENFKHSIRNIKKIITISETTKKEILNYFDSLSDEDIKVIYQGIGKHITLIEDKSELTEFKRSFFGTSNIEYILYLGSFTERKNIVNLLYAYKNLIKKKVTHKLVLVGKPLDLYKKVKFLIDDLELTNHVVLKEYVAENHISHLLSAASLFVFPSFSEGFGLPVLEAMKCGCPCIISDIPVFRELNSDAAIRIDPYSVDDIANAIYLLLTNNSMRQKYTTLSIKKAELFSWDKTAKKTIEVYKELN